MSTKHVLKFGGLHKRYQSIFFGYQRRLNIKLNIPLTVTSIIALYSLQSTHIEIFKLILMKFYEIRNFITTTKFAKVRIKKFIEFFQIKFGSRFITIYVKENKYCYQNSTKDIKLSQRSDSMDCNVINNDNNDHNWMTVSIKMKVHREKNLLQQYGSLQVVIFYDEKTNIDQDNDIGLIDILFDIDFISVPFQLVSITAHHIQCGINVKLI